MARANTKIGDIFSVKVDEKSKKYLQYIVSDLMQLNSDVIRAFKKSYPIDANPELLEIVQGEVEFYAHCVTKWGIKLGFWEKVGNINIIGETKQILFRGTRDYGHKAGEEPIKVSKNWHIWNINDKDFTRIGELIDGYKKAEIGVVINPGSIVQRMRTGKYDFFYPDYE